MAAVVLPSATVAGALVVSTPTCTVVGAANGDLQIDWQAADGAVAYVVYRNVDGGADFWRGRTAGLTFVDSDRPGTLGYSVVAVSSTNERSAATTCTDGGAVTAQAPPTACRVAMTGPGALTINWQRANGAADYIVSRSVDGSPSYWRGRVDTTTFTDTDRTGLLEYFVVARSAGGQASVPAPCEAQPAPDVKAPANCQVIRTGPATLDVRWSQSPGAVDYIVSRRFNGAAFSWRGRTADLHFADTDRVGALRYNVVAVSASGQRSGVRPCADEQLDPATIDLVAVGDLVNCNGGGAQRVSDLIGRLPGRILGLGDFVYETGSTVEFETCFDPIFGGQRDRFDPAPGNHEYMTPNAAPYFAYFGAAAGDPTKGYYAMQVGNWQILSLNSNCGQVGGCDTASPQGQWLGEQLASAPAGVCRIAYMHHPRFSSYTPYDDALYLEPLHQQLFDAGTDLVITGHAHHYERFGPVSPDGTADYTRGITNLTVGTGGVPLRGNLTPKNTSAVRITDAWGVLDLDLRENDYSWRFVDVDGRILDSGTETCISSR